MINTIGHMEWIFGAKNYRVLDLRPLPAEKRCFRVSEAFQAVHPGSAFILVLDEDPAKVFQHCRGELKERFAWEMIQEGPDEWRILITKIREGPLA